MGWAMTDTAVAAADTPPRNRRPEQVSALFFQGEAYNNWALRNWRKRRFYVLNLRHAMEAMRVAHTTLGPAFNWAPKMISEETTWGKQYAGDYTCSRTQVYPEEYGKAKHFDKAVAIIVALERYAQENDRSFNVYEYLRIVPAFYFVDRFDAAKLAALEERFAQMSEADRLAAFRPIGDKELAGLSFSEICLIHLEQVDQSGLLPEMAAGACVTRYVADALVAFVNAAFPRELHIGPVREAGDDSATNLNLGTGDAAAALRVPRYRDPAELPPIYPE
jgi:hypothetical protein